MSSRPPAGTAGYSPGCPPRLLSTSGWSPCPLPLLLRSPSSAPPAICLAERDRPRLTYERCNSLRQSCPPALYAPEPRSPNASSCGPVRSGEPLTDARFLSPSALAYHLLAYPLRLDDAEIVSLLHVGDRIDLFAATSTAADSANQLARAVSVVALPSRSAASSSGALVVIAARSDVVSRVAQATANTRITVALTPDTS